MSSPEKCRISPAQRATSEGNKLANVVSVGGRSDTGGDNTVGPAEGGLIRQTLLVDHSQASKTPRADERS